MDDIFLGRIVKRDNVFFWVDIGEKKLAILPYKSSLKLSDGDFVFVQVVRTSLLDDASSGGFNGIRLTTNLHFVGKYCIYHPFKKVKKKEKYEFLNSYVSLREFADKNSLHDVLEESKHLENIYKKCLMHKEVGLCWNAPSFVERLIRDMPQSFEIIFNDENIAAYFCKRYTPNCHFRIAKLYERPVSHGFLEYDIWEEVENSHVVLPYNGSIYIEEGACCTTIDVNSGSGDIMSQNIEAAEKICQQIALRQLSGPIIIDFAGSFNNFLKKKIETIMLSKLNQLKIKDTKILGWTSLDFLEILRPCYFESITKQIKKLHMLQNLN